MATEWNNLPIDVLDMIVKSSTQNTRNALRACSSVNREVVEATRLKRLHYLQIYKRDMEYDEKSEISIKEKFGEVLNLKFKNFEDVQKELDRILEPIDCINELEIENLITGDQIKLISDRSQRKLRVESVKLHCFDGAVVENVLSQIEPVYLRKVFMLADGGNSRIYDMPQIIHAEQLIVDGKTLINEAQLFKLKARHVSLVQPSFCLLNYFKKCTRDVGRIMPRFKFHLVNPFVDLYKADSTLEKKEIFMDTDVPEIKLKISHRFDVKGTLVFQSQRAALHISPFHRPAFRRIEHLDVSFYVENKKCTIMAAYKFQSREVISTESISEVQTILDNILENTERVKKFHIGLSPAMKWKPRKNKLIVNKLRVCAKNLETIKIFLQQIDPLYLEYLEISTQDKIVEEDFNMPHIQNLEKLSICNEKRSRSGYRIIRMIEWGHEESSHHDTGGNMEEFRDRFATEKFINRYLKHVIQRLDKKTCYFNFYEDEKDEKQKDHHLNLLKMLDGVNVIGSKRSEYDTKLYIYVDSPYPEYVILLIYRGNEIFARRENRKFVQNDGLSFLFNYLTKPGRNSNSDVLNLACI